MSSPQNTEWLSATSVSVGSVLHLAANTNYSPPGKCVKGLNNILSNDPQLFKPFSLSWTLTKPLRRTEYSVQNAE